MGLSKALYTALLAALILSLIGCGGTVSAAGPGGTNPQILAVSPNVAKVATNITLQVQGENFTPESEVVWNGFAKPTAFVSPTLLVAKISSADVAQPSTATVYVNDSKSNLKSNASHVKVVGPLTVTSTTLSNAVVGSGFSTTLTASGGKSPYTWGAETALPAGLSLSSSGSITGTPTQAGSYSFGVNVQDRSMPRLTASATVSLTVVSGGSKLSATSATLPAATTGKSYAATLTESGGTSPYSWSATTSLPPGLSLNSTGALSGTPTTAGTFSFTAQVKDSSSQSSSGSYNITISTAAAPLIVATTSLPGGTSGTSYSKTLSASGGTAPYTWSATTTIPAGLTLSSTGVLGGTPTTSGTFNIGVKVIDTASPAQSATASLPLTIAAAPSAPLAISTSSIPNGTAGQSYNVSLIATGGTSPYQWSATTAVPAGLTFSTSGTLSGTPSSSGTYSLGVKVVDSSSTQKSATASFSFTVAAAASTPVSITTSSVPAATSGTGYSYNLGASGGTAPYTWALAGGALPSGLALSSTGTISGTPTTTGTSGFTAKVTDSKGSTASGTFSMIVSAPPTSSSGSATPKMPQVYVDTSYPAVTGNTIYVHAGGNLQSAIDNANPGDQIVLDAGITLTGNFILRYKSGQDSNTNYIVIRSSGTLPSPGTRVSPSNASSMARIQSSNTDPALQTDFGAHHYRLVGLEITKVTNPTPTYAQYADLSYGIIWLGGQLPGTTQYPSTTSQLPHHIIVDRCYVHGDYNAPHGETYRGIMMNGNYIGVVDSYISNMHSEYIEVQGLESFSANGPFKIVNNYIEAAGENVIFGGSDPVVPNAVPSDIEFRHNHLSKPLTWDPYDPSFAGINYSVKNLFELKNAQRVWVDGNIMEHNWVKSQDGKAVLFTVRNQSGGCTWCVVQDITFTNNIVRSTAGVFNTIPVDYNYPSQQMQRVLVENNLFYDLGGAKWGDTTGGYGIFAAVNGGQWPGGQHYTILNMTFNHNTAFPTKDTLEMDIAPAATNFTFTNNLVTSGSYGIFGSGYGTGTPAINEYLISPTFGGDVLIGGASSGPYPTGIVTPNSISDVGFVNYSGGDFHLSSSSPYKNAGTDGKDIGADIDQLNSKTGCALQGVSCQ